ncbi:hypothetical protein HZS_5375, partial [Henneguya salminicola]
YNFCPFFTIQPNLETRLKQLKLWCDLVINYCKFNNISSFSVQEISKTSLFNNAALKRSLNTEGIMLVLEELARSGNLEWKSNKKQCLLYFQSIDTIGKYILDWVNATGNNGTVFTISEIKQIEHASFDFEHLDEEILMKCFKYLEKNEKAVIFTSS